MLDVAGRDQRPDVAGGDDLAVDLDQRHHPRLEAAVGGQHLRVAGGAVAEAEVLPHRHVGRPQPLDQHVVDELRRALGGELRRRTRSPPAPAPRARSISSALRSRLVSSLGVAWGRITASGWGSKVSTVSLPAITSRWPRWTPSNSPTATRRGRGATSLSLVSCMARKPSCARPISRRPTTGLTRPVRPAGARPARSGRSASVSRTIGPLGAAAGDRLRRGRRAAPVRHRGRARAGSQRVVEPDAGAPGRRRRRRTARSAVRRSCSQ